MPTSSFRKALAGVQGGEVIIPQLRVQLYDPKFKTFQIEMPDIGSRRPDNWFHPSTHPVWPELTLYYYLAHPKDIIPEPLDPTSTMAITQGHFWHTFMEKCLMRSGFLVAAEVSVQDDETGSRGHMDGLSKDDEVFEFKTMNRMTLSKIPRGAPTDPALVEWLRETKPEYYMQGQEYMRLSGYQRWRGLFLALEYPFEMREIAMEADPYVAHQIRDKYMRVRQAVADQLPPHDCCGSPRSAAVKQCPARGICPVAQI